MPVGLRDLGRQDIKYAVIDVSNTTGTLVAAVAGKKITVVSYCVGCESNSTIVFLSNTTALTGAMPPRASGDSFIECGWNPDGHFQTASGEALKMTHTGSNNARGHLTYFEC